MNSFDSKSWEFFREVPRSWRLHERVHPPQNEDFFGLVWSQNLLFVAGLMPFMHAVVNPASGCENSPVSASGQTSVSPSPALVTSPAGAASYRKSNKDIPQSSIPEGSAAEGWEVSLKFRGKVSSKIPHTCLVYTDCCDTVAVVNQWRPTVNQWRPTASWVILWPSEFSCSSTHAAGSINIGPIAWIPSVTKLPESLESKKLITEPKLLNRFRDTVPACLAVLEAVWCAAMSRLQKCHRQTTIVQADLKDTLGRYTGQSHIVIVLTSQDGFWNVNKPVQVMVVSFKAVS